MYSVFCAIAVIFVIFVVPETKGRDLEDIAKLFVKNRRQSMQTNSVTTTKPSIAIITNESNGTGKQINGNSINGVNGNDSDITKL